MKNQKDIDWNGLDGWAIFSTAVEPAFMEKHITATSSHELWSKLKAIYEPKSEVSKQILWDHFFAIKKSSNETVYQLVACIILAAQKLCNVSVKCDDDQVIVRILFNLPIYLVIEQLWEALEPSRRTIVTLKPKFNVHEERLNRRAEMTETTAYKARQVTAPTTKNNDDDKKKKKKKNDDWKKNKKK